MYVYVGDIYACGRILDLKTIWTTFRDKYDWLTFNTVYFSQLRGEINVYFGSTAFPKGTLLMLNS